MPVGRLVLVATPIGNLADMSERARAELAGADLILAEDTRRTRALLTHFGIAGKPVERLDAEVEHNKLEQLCARLAGGACVALCSDAGMPVVSDPGAALVRAAASAGIEVVALPGPSAVTAAIAVSGFSGDRFRFFGYLPRSGADRRELLASMMTTEETVVFFESPQRIAETLRDCAAVMPGRQVAIARELSKLHEEVVRGRIEEVAAGAREWHGEITVVLGPHRLERARMSEVELDARIEELLAGGMRARDVSKALSLESGWAARDIYTRIVSRER